MDSHKTTSQAKKRALLIGIDSYQRDESKPETPRFRRNGKKIVIRDLAGAVNDVLAVRSFLRNTMGVEDNDITMLLAPVPGRKYRPGLPEGRYQEPTYDNIIRALVQLAKDTASGNLALAYVHYSGHGGRATTVFGDLKDEDALDHSIVPSDVTCGGKYLRDIEIGALLQDIAGKHAILTVVLDCCYSGGALRDEDEDDEDEDDDEGVRRIRPSYQSAPELDLPIHKDSKASIDRWGNVEDWIRSPKDFVAITACQHNQKALEKVVERDGSKRRHGLLTHWLLDTIRTSPLGLSSDAIYNRVCFKVQNAMMDQMPHIIGDRERFFFDTKFRPRIHALAVKRVDFRDNQVRKGSVILGGGSPDGVLANSVYSILPIEFDLSKQITQDDVLARVRVTAVELGTSTTAFVEPDRISRWQEIGEGCPAVLYSLPIEKQSTVQFCAANDNQLRQFEEQFALALGNSDTAFLKLVSDDAFFKVKVDMDGDLEVSDQVGLFPPHIADTLYPITWGKTDTMDRLVNRLGHIARFNLIRNLENPGFREYSLARLVSVTVVPAPSGRTFQGKSCPAATEMIAADGGVYKMPERVWFRIRIENNTTETVGCVIFNLCPEFEIRKVYPGGEPFKSLSPGETAEDDFITVISSNLAGLKKDIPLIETFKVFVCSPQKDLNSLRLYKLRDVEGEFRDDGEELENPPILDATLSGLLRELSPITREGYGPDDEPVKGDWHTADIRVQVDRS